ncbi:transposase [Halomonas cerina]|uniref:Putative transposase n=1 Tax=Halomonas cerina TaxID=447424 RepID=A0A839VDF9_9GAMM|nr:transposase [Halomonas cerina]MBB3192168.1 putative transposase [Halomonas cerina]
MARQARLLLPETPLHLIQRGNNRSVCFAGDDDCRSYLELLGGISAMMKRLGQRYAQRFNRLYRRTGTLFEGRFRSCLVAETPYLLACHTYIELNPVRAGMVAHPGEYRWSSYRVNAQGDADPLVTPHPTMAALGATHEQRCHRYRELFRHQFAPGMVGPIRQTTHSGLVLGSERFQHQVAELLGRRTTLGKPGRKPRRRDS